MDVLKRQTELDKPLHNDSFTEVFVLLAHFLDVVGQVAHLTKLHNNDEFAFVDKTCLVGNNMRMAQVPK